MDQDSWDPQAIVEGLTPSPFPLQPPVADKAEVTPIEERFGLPPDKAAYQALTETQLYTAPELEQLELAARGYPVDRGQLFELLHRYFNPPK